MVYNLELNIKQFISLSIIKSSQWTIKQEVLENIPNLLAGIVKMTTWPKRGGELCSKNNTKTLYYAKLFTYCTQKTCD